jgi:hypothetical protein
LCSTCVAADCVVALFIHTETTQATKMEEVMRENGDLRRALQKQQQQQGQQPPGQPQGQQSSQPVLMAQFGPGPDGQPQRAVPWPAEGPALFFPAPSQVSSCFAESRSHRCRVSLLLSRHRNQRSRSSNSPPTGGCRTLTTPPNGIGVLVLCCVVSSRLIHVLVRTGARSRRSSARVPIRPARLLPARLRTPLSCRCQASLRAQCRPPLPLLPSLPPPPLLPRSRTRKATLRLRWPILLRTLPRRPSFKRSSWAKDRASLRSAPLLLLSLPLVPLPLRLTISSSLLLRKPRPCRLLPALRPALSLPSARPSWPRS